SRSGFVIRTSRSPTSSTIAGDALAAMPPRYGWVCRGATPAAYLTFIGFRDKGWLHPETVPGRSRHKSLDPITMGRGRSYARRMLEQKRVLATSIPGPKSQALQQRKLAAVSAGVGTGLPVYIEQAAGGILRDVDGNQLIDFGSGIAVTTVGNGNQRVIDAVTAQINDFTHTCFMVTPYEEYVAVAEQLAELTPGTHEKRSALFNSGSEAVENAVKVARHATGRQAVVAFDHAYHGRTNLTMALTAKSMPY